MKTFGVLLMTIIVVMMMSASVFANEEDAEAMQKAMTIVISALEADLARLGTELDTSFKKYRDVVNDVNKLDGMSVFDACNKLGTIRYKGIVKELVGKVDQIAIIMRVADLLVKENGAVAPERLQKILDDTEIPKALQDVRDSTKALSEVSTNWETRCSKAS